MIHELKCWTEYYQQIFMGKKTFEVRKNDRNYKVGDVLMLKEYLPNLDQFTNNVMARNVTSILEGGQFGIEEGYVVM